jgi:serine/threonine-protein kinase
MNAPVREGDILVGKYRVERVLGVGGMGVVVLAHHLHLDERVALKFLLPEALGNQEAVARFAREARAAVKIKSEHVARVSDVGTLDSGAPYIVMEYLEGSDLSAWLSRHGPLPIEQATEFVLQACEAIAEAHTMGIVHRDLKPANMFVIRQPDGALSVKVLDFGISKVTNPRGNSDPSMTKTSALLGSPLYMSPEQMHSSKNVDARTDIWALGVILYEIVSGAPPFSAETMPELVVRVMSTPPQPLRNARPDAPGGFEAVVLKCLEKDRNARFASVGDLAAALMPFAPERSRASFERISGVLRSAGMASEPPRPSTEGAVVAGAGTASSWGRTTSRASPAPWVFGGLVLAIAGGALLLQRKAAEEMPPSAVPSVARLAAQPPTSVSPVVAPSVSASAAPLGSNPIETAHDAAPASPPAKATAMPSKAHALKPPLRSPPAAGAVAPIPAERPTPAPAKTSTMFDDRK